MEEYYIAIPTSLNLEQRLSKFSPDFAFSKDYCYYFLAELIRESFKKNTNENTDINAIINYFIPRASTLMQRLYRRSKQHLDYLYESFHGEGPMLHRMNYEAGRSYSYRLPKYYWGDGQMKIISIREKALVKKIQKNTKVTIHNQVRKKIDFLRGYFDLKLFELDHQSALIDIYVDYKSTGNYKKYLSNVLKVVDFKNGYFPFYHKPNTDGRLHTAITTFPKICRKHLKYDNESLAEVDLSASIPFFLSYLLDLTVNSASLSLSTTKPVQSQINNPAIQSLYMLVKSSVSLSSKEVADFKELVLNDKVYDHFMFKFLNMPGFATDYENRNEKAFDGDIIDLRKYSKGKLLSMLFAKNSQYQQEQAIFSEEFPTIHKFVKAFKSMKVKGVKTTHVHKRLSYLLFQIESYFMLKIIAREINVKHKRKIPLFTLHDCIVARESDIEKVHEEVHAIFMREIGYAPNLKVTYWV
ncbi:MULTISPECIES: hypothetical protein [Chryseobacterium]|uniref:DNA-directed DNA polymerase family A palm domain-containing protein n=2 Tax=Chryseobacterium TaxID=59732 RepID=A0ABR4UFQ4_9FLAO|nr:MULTISPECIES: hypothetical protein [Chryseobacterium]KFF23191.1 hypothetical protein IW16_26510 [Chryseobacterium vrystaatense]MCD1119098.1 hypothetical protein [Chryseobacterium turcicum]